MDRIVARRALLAAAAVGIAAQALLVEFAFGLNIAALTAALVAVAAMLAVATGRRIDPADLWIPIAALVVAAGTAIRSDPFLVLLDLATAAALIGASVAALAETRVTRRSITAIVALGTSVLAWSGAGIIRLSMLARLPGDGPRRSLPAPARAIGRGLLIALPVVTIFAVLFASADAIFASLTDSLFDWQVDLGEVPLRAAVAFLVAWVVAGLFAVATGLVETSPAASGEPDDAGPDGAPMWQSLGAAVAAPPAAATQGPVPRLGVVEAVTILVAVDALFAVFVGLQLAYLFGGLDTLAAGGITYANYARRGFFELVAVTCLSGCLVVGLNAVVARRTRAFVTAAVALAGLTAVVLVSAAFRLGLYQAAYGWTELRFYVAATIAWLGVGIAAAIVLLIGDRMRWLAHAMTVGALVVLVAVNVVGPQRLVADENVARLLDPALVPPDGRPGLDLGYALTLGHDADPALVRALPAVDPADREWLVGELEVRWIDLGRPELAGWPAWNLARQRASEALATVRSQ